MNAKRKGTRSEYPRAPAPAEREALGLFPCPVNCKRRVHVWQDRQRKPKVREL